MMPWGIVLLLADNQAPILNIRSFSVSLIITDFAALAWKYPIKFGAVVRIVQAEWLALLHLGQPFY